MTDTQRAVNFERQLDLADAVIASAREFALNQFSSTVGREKLIRMIDGYLQYSKDNLKESV